MKFFEGWAPPVVWGPWIEFAGLAGGPSTYKIDLETLSSAPSTFEAELVYFKDGGERTDIVIGPTSHTFTAGSCVCVSKIRFRSYSMGQIIRMTVK